jgi:hypothetical protein
MASFMALNLSVIIEISSLQYLSYLQATFLGAKGLN